MGRSVTFILRTRHFRCVNPSCQRKIFAEPLTMAGPYMRMTHDVFERVRHEAVNQTAQAATRTLSIQHIRTSLSTCHRIVRRLGASNPQVHTSGYVGIDDFAKKKGQVYACAVVDHYTRDTLAVFDSRYGFEISDWFAAHPEINLVTRDGSRSYATIISAASPDAIQVSDRFHLIKSLRDTAVGLVKGMLGKKGNRMAYPYPDEEEAYDLIFSDMLEMGGERHRTKVHDYYRVRNLKDEGYSISGISSRLSISSRRVYTLLHTDISRILLPEQKKILCVARKMAQVIASGIITPESVLRRLDGTVPSRLVHRCMRGVISKYSELRKQVKEYNEKHREKDIKVSEASIWNYIQTGNTSSRKLLMLHKTHPDLPQAMNLCMDFCAMIHARDGAPDVTTWIRRAEASPYRQMKSFAQYVKSDKKAIEQAYLTNYSNALLEGNVNRAKAIKRAMFNRAGIEALRTKMIYQGRPKALKFCT